MIQAIILAGGRGERLAPLTDTIAKPAIDVAGKPIIRHILYNLYKYGVTDILVKTHYLPNTVQSAIGSDSDVTIYREHVLHGTAFFLKRLDLANNFFVVNGDTISNVDLTEMYELHLQSKNIATIFTKDTALHTGGTYIFSKKVLKYIPNKPDFMIVDLIQKLIDKDIPLTLYEPDTPYFDCGTPEKLEKAREYFAKT